MGYITVNKRHFFHNLDQICNRAGDINKVAIVLKDNAYGHGLETMAQLCHEYKIEHAVVRTLQEASQIQTLFQTILVLADIPNTLQASRVHISINDLTHLDRVVQGSSIELKFDTGMHRNGLSLDQIELAFEKIIQNKLVLKGVFTHHRSADEVSSEFFWQEKQFEIIKQKVLLMVEKHALERPRFHSANSAGLFRANHQHDIVRVGIAAFGLLQLPALFKQPLLKPVLSLWAKKIASLELKAHQKVGYSGSQTVNEDTLASTYDIGYGDGLLRLSDQILYKTPNDSTMIGRVSMDNTIFSSQDKELCIFDDANLYATKADTISYELLVRLNPNLKREITE